MTALLKLTPSMRWADPRPARAEHVDLHQLVTDDVEAHEEHAVLHELGAHDVGEPEGVVVQFGLADGAPGVDVGAQIATRTDPAKGGVAAPVTQREAVHQEEPGVALLGLGQVLLHDHVAVTADRVDHLVEVGHDVGGHQEDVRAPRTLERLEHAVSRPGRARSW